MNETNDSSSSETLLPFFISLKLTAGLLTSSKSKLHTPKESKYRMSFGSLGDRCKVSTLKSESTGVSQKSATGYMLLHSS